MLTTLSLASASQLPSVSQAKALTQWSDISVQVQKTKGESGPFQNNLPSDMEKFFCDLEEVLEKYNTDVTALDDYEVTAFH